LGHPRPHPRAHAKQRWQGGWWASVGVSSGDLTTASRWCGPCVPCPRWGSWTCSARSQQRHSSPASTSSTLSPRCCCRARARPVLRTQHQQRRVFVGLAPGVETMAVRPPLAPSTSARLWCGAVADSSRKQGVWRPVGVRPPWPPLGCGGERGKAHAARRAGSRACTAWLVWEPTAWRGVRFNFWPARVTLHVPDGACCAGARVQRQDPERRYERAGTCSLAPPQHALGDTSTLCVLGGLCAAKPQRNGQAGAHALKLQSQ